MTKHQLSLRLLLTVIVCGGLSPTAAAIAQTTAASGPVAPADAQTTKIVDAANAFLATLTTTQKQAAVFGFNDAAQRMRWSNFPVGIFARVGVKWGDLNPVQRTALLGLLGANYVTYQ
jgi:hypothetical protein